MSAPRSNSANAFEAQTSGRIPVFGLTLAGIPKVTGVQLIHATFTRNPSFSFVDMTKDIRGSIMQARTAVEGSILFFTVANHRQATVVGVVAQACQSLIRNGTMRVLAAIVAENQKEEIAIQRVIQTAGVGVVDDVKNITPKAAEFKLRQLGKIARYNALEGERKSKTTLDELLSIPIHLKASLPGEIDIWSIQVVSGVQKRRGFYSWSMIGPPPVSGRWVKEEIAGRTDLANWKWIANKLPEWMSDVDPDLFRKEPGNWYFRGLCPQFLSNSGNWTFSSSEPSLEFHRTEAPTRNKLELLNGQFVVAQDSVRLQLVRQVIERMIMGPIGIERGAVDVTRKDRPPKPVSLQAVFGDLAGESAPVDVPLSEAQVEQLYEALFEEVPTSISVIFKGNTHRGRVLDLFESEITLELFDAKFLEGDRTWVRFQAPGRNGGSPIELVVAGEVLETSVLDNGAVSVGFKLEDVDLEVMSEFVSVYQERQKAVVDFLSKAKGE